MLSQFEKKVAAFTTENGLFDSVDRVLLAVSGGADSLALMYAMYALKGEGIFNAELLCAHINHQLRQGEADVDEEFVVAQATKLKLPVITGRVDVRGFARNNKLSIETAARKLRIENLLDIARHNNCGCIATGHQKNDNAETVLQRLARGTGFRGLAGIWAERVFKDTAKFVRPLLCVTREEILNYLEKRNLNWCIDRTNADCTYRRNYIRHRLLPVLQQDCAISIVEQLAELSQSAYRLNNMVCRRADKVWAGLADSARGRAVLKLESFLPEHPAVKVELVRRGLAAIGSGEKNLTQAHYERICHLARQGAGSKTVELPGGFLVHREYGDLIFTRPGRERGKRSAEYSALEIPGRTRLGGYLVEANVFEAEQEKFETLKAKKSDFVECFDLDKLKLPLAVRLRQAGDSFWPLGLPGQKKVGKFLTDAKVPQEIRGTVLIVADREKIIWVCPIRISEQAKVTAQTGKILQLQIVV